MSPGKRTRIVILDAGFGDLHTPRELERTLARDSEVEVTLVNRENFFLFTPMLHEVAASDLVNDRERSARKSSEREEGPSCQISMT